MTLKYGHLTLKMTSDVVKNVTIELADPQNPLIDPEIVPLLLIELIFHALIYGQFREVKAKIKILASFFTFLSENWPFKNKNRDNKDSLTHIPSFRSIFHF